jgi:hypothetical protein
MKDMKYLNKNLVVAIIILISGLSIPLNMLLTIRTQDSEKKTFYSLHDSANGLGGALWNLTYGGAGRDDGYHVDETSDGGFIVTGLTDYFGTGSGDLLLFKTNSSGDIIWDKSYGGLDEDWGNFVTETPDGGFIITGRTKSFGAGSSDIWLIKTDANGNMQWNKTFGGVGFEVGWEIEITSSGDFIILGYTNSSGAGFYDAWLIATDSFGNHLWNYTYGGSERDYGYSLEITDDEGYVIAGRTNSSGTGTYDYWLFKVNSTGSQMWEKSFGGIGIDNGISLITTLDGGYIINGYSNSFSTGDYDFWIVKADSEGNYLWNKTYGDSFDDEGWSVERTNDGGFVVTGYTTNVATTYWDFWLIKFDENGNHLWNYTYSNPYYDWGYCVKLTSEGGYILTGLTYSISSASYDVWLIKIEGNEDIEPPIINNPQDIAYFYNSTENFLVWNASDENPYYFNVSKNGETLFSDFWVGDLINISIDGLPIGNYIYTCKVYDKAGRFISDSVLVKVIERSEAFPWLPVVISILIVGIIIVINGLRISRIRKSNN